MMYLWVVNIVQLISLLRFFLTNLLVLYTVTEHIWQSSALFYIFTYHTQINYVCLSPETIIYVRNVPHIHAYIIWLHNYCAKSWSKRLKQILNDSKLLLACIL